MSTLSSGLPRLDELADAELISAVRGGDVDAYGELFGRHVEAARRLARQLVSAGEVDDLVSEAFAKVLGILQRGGGPDLAFRAYLLTAVRRLRVDRIRAGARLTTTDDLTPFDPGVPFRDTVVEGFESAAAAKAFASLPERWQLVLWHTEVEGQKPAEVAPLLGMTPNSVSALAYRAREGLRQAFLSMHVQETEDGACAWTHRQLGAFVRGGVSRRDAGRIEDHLDECRPCAAIYLELTEVNSNLSGLLAPLLLGGVAGGYLAAAGTAAGSASAKGALLLLLDRSRDFVAAHGSATAVAGVAATAVIGGAVLTTLLPDTGREVGSASGSIAGTGPASDASAPVRDRSGTGDQDGRGGDRGPGDAAPTTSPDPGTPAPTSPAQPTGPTEQPSPAAPEEPGGPASPTPTPTPTPTPEPTPTGTDLAVTAAARASSPATYEVTVVVVGTPDAGGATLTISGGPSLVLTLDGRCEPLAAGSGTCAVAGSPATYTFTAAAPPGATLTFTVTGEDDPDLSDNRATVRFGG